MLAAESKRATVEAYGRRLAGAKVVVLPDALFAGIAATETSQGVMALVQPREWKFEQLVHGKALVVVLDALQDPGNAGTIVRAAEAFGATGILFLKGTASPHNPKTLRASAGSLFRVPFLHGMATATALATLRQNGVKLFAAMPAGSTAAGNAAHGHGPHRPVRLDHRQRGPRRLRRMARRRRPVSPFPRWAWNR